jgi:Lar family restriction alleviation protein
MSGDLKPCPFCGSEMLLNHLSWVRCSECGGEGPLRQTSAEAIAAWNTRVILKGKKE